MQSISCCLAAMVGLVEERLRVRGVHRSEQLAAVCVRRIDDARQPIWIERFAEADDIAIKVQLRRSEGRRIAVRDRVVWEHRFGRRAVEPAEILPVDEKDVVQGAQD